MFAKIGICEMTCGDHFSDAMEEGKTPDITLSQWFLNQDCKLHELMKKCGNIVLLFDKESKDFMVSKSRSKNK